MPWEKHPIMQTTETRFDIFTVYANENDSDFDAFFNRVGPEVLDCFEKINPRYTRLEFHFELQNKKKEMIVDHYDDDVNSMDYTINRIVRVLRSKIRNALMEGLQMFLDENFDDCDTFVLDDDDDDDDEIWCYWDWDWDWDLEDVLENPSLSRPIVNHVAKGMESNLSHIRIKMLNLDKEFHRLEFKRVFDKLIPAATLSFDKQYHKVEFKSVLDELVAVAWHPDRMLDWCLDHEELRDMKERWNM